MAGRIRRTGVCRCRAFWCGAFCCRAGVRQVSFRGVCVFRIPFGWVRVGRPLFGWVLFGRFP
jgi:hypothetical protein